MARPVARVLLTTVPALAMHHINGVALSFSLRLQPSVVEVALVDERIMRLRLKHSLSFMSVVAVYASTEVCETEGEGVSKYEEN